MSQTPGQPPSVNPPGGRPPSDKPAAARLPAARWLVTVRSGPHAGRPYPLDDQVRIGRSSDNDIVVPDMRASRNHVRVECVGDDCFMTDLGSSNGTLVNGRRIEGTVQLADGDVFTVGCTEFMLAAGAAPAERVDQTAGGNPLPLYPGPGEALTIPMPVDQPPAPPAPPPAASICSGCGSALPSGAKFCTICGLAAAAPPPVAAAPPPAPSPAAAPAPAPPPAHVPPPLAAPPAHAAPAPPPTPAAYIPPPAPPAAMPSAACPQCREPLTPGSRFCTTCGYPVSAAPPAAAPPPAYAPSPAYAPPPVAAPPVRTAPVPPPQPAVYAPAPAPPVPAGPPPLPITQPVQPPASLLDDAIFEKSVASLCPECGHPLDPGARFCITCGRPVA